MRQMYYMLLMVALPTGLFAFSNSESSATLWGNYYDPYSNTEILIKDHRRGIRVRVNGRRWRTYNYMGRGIYDDCNGRVIQNLGYGDIKYIIGRRRNTIILSRSSNNRFNDYRPSRYSNYNNRGNQFGSYAVDRFCGSWGCSDPGITLRIEAYGNGFRARNNAEAWVYYDRYQDGSYRDRRGNRYYFDNQDLCWSSNRGNRIIRFRRRG